MGEFVGNLALFQTPQVGFTGMNVALKVNLGRNKGTHTSGDIRWFEGGSLEKQV